MLSSVSARRRSVDNGTLALAAENRGSGYGWGGFEEREELECVVRLVQRLTTELITALRTPYAERLSQMYIQTLHVSEFNDCLYGQLYQSEVFT
jgi:hypothetical protein